MCLYTRNWLSCALFFPLLAACSRVAQNVAAQWLWQNP